jgi:hypothetical protein
MAPGGGSEEGGIFAERRPPPQFIPSDRGNRCHFHRDRGPMAMKTAQVVSPEDGATHRRPGRTVHCRRGPGAVPPGHFGRRFQRGAGRPDLTTFAGGGVVPPIRSAALISGQIRAAAEGYFERAVVPVPRGTGCRFSGHFPGHLRESVRRVVGRRIGAMHTADRPRKHVTRFTLCRAP